MSLDELEQLMQVPPTETGDRPVIVVIDDDPSIRSSLLTVLKDRYTIRSCSNGIDGVRAVDDQVSCVILDVKMPTHDGFWVCKHVRKRNPDVPVIFHSGYQDSKNPTEVVSEFRPFGYVVKGSTLAALLDLVANAVRHSARIKASRGTVEQLREAREKLRQVSGQTSESTDASPVARAAPQILNVAPDARGRSRK